MVKWLIVILLVAGALGYWYWTTTPTYSVLQIRSSIKNHDVAAFEKYADIDSLASHMVDDLLTKPVQQALGPGIIGQLLGYGLGVFVKPVMVSGIKEQIVSYIEGESRESTSYQDDGAKQSSTHVFRGIPGQLGFGGKIFQGIDYVRTEGKLSYVGLKLHNEKHDADLVLELKLRDAGGHWRLVELSNLQSFMGKIVELQTKQQKETESMRELGSCIASGY